MSRRAAVVSLALAALAALLVSSVSGSGPDLRPIAGERYEFEGALPAGWARSRHRLVPKLLMPREILSVGTAPMPVGGGGNCGREPRAAIGRMRPGDALVTIQEYAVTARMRRHLTRSFPPLAWPAAVSRLERSYAVDRPGPPVLLSTIPFSEAGRAFDALVYFRGRPTAELRDAAAQVLADLDFRGGARPVRPRDARP